MRRRERKVEPIGDRPIANNPPKPTHGSIRESTVRNRMNAMGFALPKDQVTISPEARARIQAEKAELEPQNPEKPKGKGFIEILNRFFRGK